MARSCSSRVERAVERHDVDRRIAHALAQQRLGAADFARRRAETPAPSPLRRAARAATASATWRLDRRARVAAEIARLDRKGAALALDHRRIAEQRRDARAVEVADITSSFRSSRRPCCTSRASARPRSASSERSWNSSNSTAATPSSDGSSRIRRVKMPSVTTSMRVRARDLRAEAHARADRLADLLAQRRRHARGRGARGEPARLQHQDLLVLRPRLVEQHQRHARGLAGAGRRDQHGGVVRASAAVSPGSAASMGSGSENWRI